VLPVGTDLKKLEDVACENCGDAGDDEELLLCDGKGCNRGYHLGCLMPALKDVPDGEWFCPACTTASPKVESLQGVPVVCAVLAVLDNLKIC
jgi:hypothetical protein